MTLESFQKWTQSHQNQIKEGYFHFLRFRTISADSSFQTEMIHCAEWLVQQFRDIGFSAKKIETAGPPLVYAEDLSAGPSVPTLLIYGHYDVQPVDPVEEWESDPFTPTERNGKIYARGALDDKGQIFFAIMALRAWKELGRPLPINVKFCIEGEEESASRGLSQILESQKELLKADQLLIVDLDLFDQKTPAITLGARGLCALGVTLTGSHLDMHSGMLGGVAYNPNRALVELLAQLWDENGRVAVPHFYEEVSEPTDEEKTLFHSALSREVFTKEFGIEAFGGEAGRSLSESLWLRPTLEINGLSGGYNGSGFKTVIPAQATAKISCRLVPNQEAAVIEKRVADFLKSRVKQGMHLEICSYGGGSPFRGAIDSPLAIALKQAYEEVMEVPCRSILTGGSIPIIADLSRISGAQVVGMGYGLPDDNIHAPNESFDLGRMEQGIWTIARTIERMGANSAR